VASLPAALADATSSWPRRPGPVLDWLIGDARWLPDGRTLLSQLSIRLIEAGMRRLLAHFGVMELPKDAPAPPATRFVEVRDRSYYVYASERGVFEPLVRLGDDVEAGQPAARVHFIENPAREPALCHFRHRGLVVCRRALGRCAPGDCLFHLATDRPAPA